MFTATLGVFLLGLVVALAGGFVGAAIGANYAFGVTGICVFVSWGLFAATGSGAGFDFLAFGPFMGPHIAFAGGVAAAAFAHNRGYADGRDVSEPLARLGRPSVLLVGAVFGLLGYLTQIGISMLPWFGTHTDSVALTVFLSAVAARLVFGGGSLLNPEKMNRDASSLWRRIASNDESFWLKWQQRPAQYLTLGAFFGILGGGSSIALATFFPGAEAWAHTFAFGFSAVVILFLILGHEMPVQHHITIIGGLAAIKFMPILAGSGFTWGEWGDQISWVAVAALLIAALFGMLSAFLAELQSNLLHVRGTTHIDPPAMAIWVSTTIVLTVAGIVG
ncbi:hypothetical protein TESS_TESS_01470 [Tessaracoccus sp. O5.2]|uniref:hypothetical protein n=1 Tax=Tessaracoccus sp. O5.2 TaxID=3157622 RepID=UPI0035E47F88